MADIYDIGDVVGKTLFAKKDLPVYTSYPTASYKPQPVAVVKSGSPAGVVYSWIDADPTQGRSNIWWMFQGGGLGSGYYYIPHSEGAFDVSTLAQQGVLSLDQKAAQAAAADQPWYETIIKETLPIVVVAILGAAVIKGYIAKQK